MYFRNYGLAKKDLGKYVKSGISEYLSTSNMKNTPKHPSN